MKKVEIIIPAHNEAKILKTSLTYLYKYLNKIKKVKWSVIIGENGSKDNTFELAKKLSKDKKFPNLRAIHLKTASRDGVLKTIWSNSKADVMLYMDADMSTHPKYTKKLIDAIAFDGYDVAIGSRLKKGSKVKRPFLRVLMSKIYNYIVLPIVLPTGVKDPQCGFKAINQKVSKNILPKLIKENGFLDTEMVAVSHYKKYRIKELAIEWEEAERDSTMSVYENIPKFLKNVLKTRLKIIKGYYD